MLIRRDPQLSGGRILMATPRREWMPPSRAQQKTFLGHEDRTRFRLRARAHDGHIVWTGWFEDRDDADAFLFAMASGTLRHERALWDLPVPGWHPDLEGLLYEFLTQTILTTTGSNQTYTSPADWNNASNQVECLGGGASGGAASNLSHHSTGGGGGAYSAITNFSFASPGVTTATYNVGIGGAARGAISGNSQNGESGGPTWFNNATDPGVGADNTKCSAAGGVNGVTGSGARNGGVGGATTSGWGETKYAGGRGGNFTAGSGTGGSGGGGAASSSGAGGNAGDSALNTANVTTAGGTSGAGLSGGAGSSGPGNPGSNGTEFSGSYGAGSGGGGTAGTSGATGGSGGNYGAGGGGARTGSFTATSGDGRQGLIIIEYTPAAAKSLLFNHLPFQHLLTR